MTFGTDASHLEPSDPSPEQGWALLAQGRKFEAADLFRKHEGAESLAGLAVASLAENRIAEALELSGQGLALADTRRTRYARALACIRGKRLDEAGILVRRLLNEHGGWPATLHAAGALHLASGEREEARLRLADAHGTGTGVLDAALNLAQLEAQDGAQGLPRALERVGELVRTCPRAAQAHAVLGRLLVRSGKATPGFKAIVRALELHPDLPMAVNGLGEFMVRLYGLGNVEQETPLSGTGLEQLRLQVEEWLQHPLPSGGSSGWRLTSLGLSLGFRGELGRALACQRKAVRIAPDSANAWANFARSLAAVDHAPRAAEAAWTAIGLAPDGRTPFFLALETLKNTGLAGDGVARARELIRADRANPWAWFLLGICLEHSGRLGGALRAMQRADALDGERLPILASLGTLYNTLGMPGEGVDRLEFAQGLAPGNASVLAALAVAYELDDQVGKALETLDKALELDPDCMTAALNRGRLLQFLGRTEEGLDQYLAMRKRHPGYAKGRSALLFSMHFSRRHSREEIAAEHRALGDMLETGRQRPAPDWDGRRPLRVGFLCGEFRNHAVHACLAPLFKGRDRAEDGKWLPYLYSDVAREDTVTAWYRRRSHVWRPIAGMADRAVARLVRADSLDLLIDLTGHTGSPRIPVYTCRPAPVQASWLGYFDTTGLACMDYLIADPTTIPLGDEHLYREKVLRLEHDFICFDPPHKGPEPGSPPMARNGWPTLGCFNQTVKLNREVAELWASIMADLPDSRLLLQSRHFDVEEARQWVVGMFTDAGVDRQRIGLLGRMARVDMLASYNAVDIALDPFPCAGGVTTLEALWMGVPVVTLLGDRFCGRHSACHIRTAGFPDLVTESLRDYRRTVVELAGNPDRLAWFRSNLRGAMLDSPLCDAESFYRNFSQLLERMARLD